MNTFFKTAQVYRQGARTMPGRYYTSSEVLSEEMEKIWRRQWISAGRTSELASPGDYRTIEIGGESLIVLRDQQGRLHAFFNVCRHRGTRLCSGAQGRLSETIQCPYHAWTYALDGRLIGAPHMQEVEGFQKSDYPLHQAGLATWNGFYFVNLDRTPRPFDEVFAPLGDRFDRFNLAALVTVRRIDYAVRANWKLVMQNYSECLHCPTIHPELSTKLPYTSGANDLVDGRFLGGYMDIKLPNQSATMSGRACGLPLGDLSPEDRSRGYYYTLFPAMMLSLHPDYAVYYTVWPRSSAESLVRCEWMVHPDSPRSPGYNIADAEEFWDRTNRQDWDICERSQLGISSSRYEPGPYSPRESMPAAWDREYLRHMGG